MQAGMRLLLVAAMLAVMLAAGMSGAAAEENAVAKIGETEYYTTLDAAIAEAEDGATITVLQNCSTSGMNLSKNLTLAGADGTKPVITFTQYGIALWGKNLTFKNCNIEMKGIGSTPYTGEWNWMTICANSNASLTLDNVNMTMDATGVSNIPHAIYFCNNNVLNIVNGSILTIKNYPQDALEWDGGNGGYNVNITDSTFVSDHNRSGFTGTFYATITNSDVDVINSTGNGSNGSHFIIKDSDVNFSDNGSHGLSAGILKIDHSIVNTNNNVGMGITVNNELEVTNYSTVTVTGNASNSSYGYAAVRLYNDFPFVVDGTSKLYIKNNKNTGLYVRKGMLTVEEGATLEITGNKVTHNLLDGYGGGIYVGYGANYDPKVILPSNAVIYNNHSLIGGDDIYVSEGINGPSLTFGAIGTAWYLDGDPDCTDAIDGWYDDAENARWEAHAAEDGANHIQKVSQGTITGLTALKAAHGIRKLDLIPQDPPTDLPIDKTASERLDEDYRAEVTLTMPSYAEPLETDVVFVLDKSTSTQVEEDALSMLDRLRAQVEGKQAIVKVGVVIFNRQANTNGLLMDLTSEYETIKNEIGKDISSGTNSHAGLMAGMDLLNGGGAANSRKYLIFVSDGKTYIFGEEPTAIPLENADRTNAFAGPDNWATKYGNDTPPASWDAYFAEIAAQIAADGNQYYVPYGTNDRYIRYEERLEHANSVDVALYRTNEVYQAAKSAGYRVFAKLKSSDIGANYLWGPAFMEYLSGGQEVSFEGIGDDMLYLYGAGTTITDVIGYGETAEHGPYDFGFVDENLMLKYGTVDDQGNFTPFGDYKPYCVSSEMDGNGNVHYYFGQGLAEDGAGYAFELIYYPNGVPGATAENDQKEHFTLTFHRNIRLGEQVQLTYNVELGENYRNKQDANLFDGLETNKNAYIDPVDSEGNAGDRQFFPVPTTEYENVHVAKVWAGDDDAAVRPNSITVTLKEPVGGTIRETSAAVDASTGWAALFLNVRKGWEIEEVQVVLDAGKGSYASSQTAEAGNASNVTLTNTYTKPEPTPTVTPIPTPTPTPAPVLPETVVTIIKVWDDSGYSGRPNAITVRLGVQNDPNYVGYNVELSPNNPNVRVSADGNTWTWSRQIVDRAYVAEEVAVPGYASKVEQNGNTFVITNTYMPATGDDTPVRTYLLIAGCAAMVLLGAGAWLLHSRRGKRA